MFVGAPLQWTQAPGMGTGDMTGGGKRKRRAAPKKKATGAKAKAKAGGKAAGAKNVPKKRKAAAKPGSGLLESLFGKR
jgi:hypothetical protein